MLVARSLRHVRTVQQMVQNSCPIWARRRPDSRPFRVDSSSWLASWTWWSVACSTRCWPPPAHATLTAAQLGRPIAVGMTQKAKARRSHFVAWGRGISGQLSILGKDSDRPLRPQPCQQLEPQPALHFGEHIVQLGAGEGYTLIVTLRGDVYACGTNESGELGQATSGPVGVCRPVLALGGRDVLRVACGLRHVVALTADGKGFAWGLNKDGQLGLGHQRHITAPQQLQLPEGCNPFHQWVDAACGLAHTLGAVRGTDRSMGMTVYAWGDGSAGCLGTGDAVTCARPVPVPLEDTVSFGDDLVQMACGSHHSLLLSREGAVFTFGLAADGRLGLPRSAPTHRPAPLASVVQPNGAALSPTMRRRQKQQQQQQQAQDTPSPPQPPPPPPPPAHAAASRAGAYELAPDEFRVVSCVHGVERALA